MRSSSTGGPVRWVYFPIAVISVLLLSTLLLAGLSSASSSAAPAGVSATLTIRPDGTVSTAGILGVAGNVYTLLAPYTGSIADERNGSELYGAGRALTYSSGTATVIVYNAHNVSVDSLVIQSTVTGVEVLNGSAVSVFNNTVRTTGLAVELLTSNAVTVSGNRVAATQGLSVSQSSAIRIEGNDANHSTTSALTAVHVAGLVVAGNNLSHSAMYGLTGDTLSAFVVQNNSITAAGSGHAVVVLNSQGGNLSGNNLGATNHSLTILSSLDVSVSGNVVTGGTPWPYTVNASDRVSILDSIAPGAGYAGVYLYGDAGVTLLRDNFAGGGVQDWFSSGVSVTECHFQGGANAIYANQSSGLFVNSSDLFLANNGLYAVASSGITVANSNLSRANFPINLTGGTRDVRVDASDLGGAQIDAVYLNNATNITINNSQLTSAAFVAVLSTATDGLTVSYSDLSGSPIRPGATGVQTSGDTNVVLSHDQIRWTAAPVVDDFSTGLRIEATDLSNTTGGGAAVNLYQDANIAVTATDFYNDSANGIRTQSTANLTVVGSNFGQVANDGIILNAGSQVTIERSVFDNEGGLGVYLAGTNGLVASGNSLSNDSYAFFLNTGSNVVLDGNFALGDRDGGISGSGVTGFEMVANNISDQIAPDLITTDLLAVSGFAITGNSFFQDNVGVYIAGGSDGTLSGNEFGFDNNSVDMQGTVRALIWHNDFVADSHWILNNTPTFAWDAGYPVGGNYWSNYTGPDAFSGPQQNVPGADGIGDQPLVLTGPNVDRYPLMSPWSSHVAVFTERGLPAGTRWSVVFNGTALSTNSSTITVVSSFGVDTRFSYSIPNVQAYAPTPRSGSGTLGAGLVTIGVVFAQPTYPLTFSESGPPGGASLTVSVGGNAVTSGNGTVIFELTNGTYNFSVAAVPGFDVFPASGRLTINGAPRSILLTFVVHTYAVTLRETGLPAGTKWSVSVGGTAFSSNQPTLNFSLANGSYAFAVGPVTGFSVTPMAGDWNISGGSLSAYVTFAPSSSSAPPGSGSLSPTNPGLVPYYAAIAGLLALALVGWLLVLLRRRKSAGPNGTRSSAPGAPPSEPPAS